MPWCGACVLLSVPDRALVTLCSRCHDVRHGRRFSRWQLVLAGLLLLLGFAALFR
jgi:hypothetical protein